jgi:hypothetical protein
LGAEADGVRFWALWTVASSLAACVAFLLGLIPAIALAAISFVLRGGPFVAYPVAAAVVGLVIGAVVGAVQSLLLPRAWGVGNRWIRQSVVGWAAGAALGALVALGLGWVLFGHGERGSTPDSSTYVLELATPISGLVLGWALRSVPPRLPMPLRWWLAAHAVAVSGGWIAARFLNGEPALGSLWGSGVIHGAGWYGVVSASVMLLVVRERPMASSDPPADAVGG